MTAVIHDFRRSLAKSESHATAAWWMDVYKVAFPNLESAVPVRQDGWAQRAGIDRVITLACGRVVTVDEKVRENDYGDILLEMWSDKERRIKGWVAKPLACDFIAYGVVPSATCYLLPTLQLQTAWRQNARGWVAKADANERGFRRVLAKNSTYTTESLAVQTQVVLDAIRDTMTVKVSGPA